MVGCTENKTSKKIVERIQYDVPIKSTSEQHAWFVNNIDGANREKFVKSMIDFAKKHQENLFTFPDLEKLNADEFDKILAHTDTIMEQSSEPPYNYEEKIIEYRLEINDISKVRFIEEWYHDDDNKIHKEVIAVAPLLENFDENGHFRGYWPLFWIFYDNEYVNRLKL